MSGLKRPDPGRNVEGCTSSDWITSFSALKTSTKRSDSTSASSEWAPRGTAGHGAKGWTCDRRCPQKESLEALGSRLRATDKLVFGDSRTALVSIGGNQQCERLQISISITPPRTPGIFLTRDSWIPCCSDV